MAMLLDTNILSTHLKRPDLTFSKFIQHGGQLCTSQIVVAELYAWCFTFATHSSGAHLSTGCLPTYHRSRSTTNVRGLRRVAKQSFAEFSSPLDLMIAATALVRDLVIVTHDADFMHMRTQIVELRVADWLDGLSS